MHFFSPMEICEYDLAADDRIILTGSRMLLRRAESSPFYVIPFIMSQHYYLLHDFRVSIAAGFDEMTGLIVLQVSRV